MRSHATCKYLYIGIMFCMIIIFNVTPLFAASVALSWDPPTTNTDGTPLTDIADYKVYYGTASGNYSQSIDVGNVTTYQVNNLTSGFTYYFVTTVYNTSGNESGYSNEINHTIQTSDTTPPVVSGIQSANVTSSSVTVSWTTNEASDTRIEYGTSTSYGNTTVLNSSMVTSHSQNISGLSSSTLYHYRVRSRDASANLAVSGDYTFTTAAPPAPVDYYCDNDSDGYINISTNGSCTGTGCEPSGCQTTPGNDCNDNNFNINPGANDSNCNGVDENCDGTADNDHVQTHNTCGEGICASTGQLICSNGSVVDTCTVDPECDPNPGPAAHPNGPYTGIEGQAIILDGSASCNVDPNGTYINAENFTGTINQGTDTFSVDTSQSGYLGTGYLFSDSGTADTCPPAHEGKQYTVNFSAPGTYNMWIRGYALNTGSDSVFIGLDDNCVGVLTENAINQWEWSNSIQNGGNTINVTTAGTHTINVWVREGNHKLDGIYLDTIGAVPTDSSHGVEIDPNNCSAGSITLYEWDIDNDGVYDYNTSSETQSHTYAQDGTYTIQLRVTDNFGATDQATTTATISDNAPTSGFTASSNSGTASLTVHFTDQSTAYDQPLTYEWDFDNNGTVDSTSQNPSYTYIGQGTYTVVLTVTDSDGSTNTLTKTDYITVQEDATLVNYYCDNDSDGYINISTNGSCTGTGCEPSGCQTTPGNDCNDNDTAVNPNNADDTCDGVDDNCDGIPDNNYVMTVVSCGTGVCTSTGQIVCQSGTEVNTCTPDIPAENPETTCNDGVDNDCDGQVDEGCFPDIKVSSVLLSEDFSSGIPSAWSVQGAWNTDNQCGQTIGFPFEGQYAIVDSCTTTGIDEFVTSSIDTVSCNSVELAFSNQYYWYAGNIEVDVSNDGGTTWSNYIRIGKDDGYPAPNWKQIDISSVAEVTDAKIRFKYSNSTSDGFWAIDNIWVTCKSSQMQFASQTEGPTSKTIMITNAGTVDLAVNTINITGQNASEFRMGGNDECSNQTLLPGETCTFDMVFTPASAGSKNANLSISSNDPDTPALNISLSGTGTDGVNPAPKIKVNGLSGVVDIYRGSKPSVTIELDAGTHSGKDADWWVLMEYRKRWYSYNISRRKWRRGLSFYMQEHLRNLGPVDISMNRLRLSRGRYTFHFGIDTSMNGIKDSNEYYDEVIVNIK